MSYYFLKYHNTYKINVNRLQTLNKGKLLVILSVKVYIILSGMLYIYCASSNKMENCSYVNGGENIHKKNICFNIGLWSLTEYKGLKNESLSRYK